MDVLGYKHPERTGFGPAPGDPDARPTLQASHRPAGGIETGDGFLRLIEDLPRAVHKETPHGERDPCDDRNGVERWLNQGRERRGSRWITTLPGLGPPVEAVA